MADLTAGDVIVAAIRDLVRQFDETEDAALSGELDGVHQHRTVVRRIRSVLQAFRYLFEPFAVMQLRGSLREWGSTLGVMRDHEVAAQLADALIDSVIGADADPRVVARLVHPEQLASAAAHRRILEVHDLERFREMRRVLHGFAAAPPLTAAAAEPADSIRVLLVHDAERVLRRVVGMGRSADSQHEVRKRARRLRHTVEAALNEPAWSDADALRAASAAGHRVQSALGDHRDATFLATRIERTRVIAGRAREDTLAYDELAAAARASADDSMRALRRAKKKLAAAVERLR